MKYEINQLLSELPEYTNIHIECNQEQSISIFNKIRKLEEKYVIGYMTESDKGYERISVQSYLKFWLELNNSKYSLNQIIEKFGLLECSMKTMRKLSLSEMTLVQIARVSIQKVDMIFLEEPLLNLKGDGISKVLNWIVECSEAGIHFITTNSSMRHALLMPGTAFYLDEDWFCMVEREEESDFLMEDNEISILKIPTKSGNTTLLFEPKDIDFIESLNKSNYISVRGTSYQVNQTMDELEQILSKSGFFRCHRSYIVNMQKVGKIEKISRNSYLLLLNNNEQSRVPLSKARVQEMKDTFGW